MAGAFGGKRGDVALMATSGMNGYHDDKTILRAEPNQWLAADGRR